MSEQAEKTMKELVNPAMLSLARESRGLFQKEVAQSIGISLSNISRIESSEIGTSDKYLQEVSKLTKYPLSFFYQQGSVFPDSLSYRKRQKVSQKVLTPINAQINIVRLHVQHLIDELQPDLKDVPVIEVTETETPQKVAIKLRKLWKISEPVIGNLTKILEAQDIIITPFHFNTARVDSRSILTQNKYPIIFYNDMLLGDRQRFSLAYELGHLVMHTFTTISAIRDISHEANLFAAEFLMPEKEMRKDFKEGITISTLIELKKKWKVSMIALLYRADDLGYLTENQKKYLLLQFNSMNIRRREPVELDIPVEKTTLLRKWITDLKAKKKLNTAQVAAALHLNTDEFIALYS